MTTQQLRRLRRIETDAWRRYMAAFWADDPDQLQLAQASWELCFRDLQAAVARSAEERAR